MFNVGVECIYICVDMDQILLLASLFLDIFGLQVCNCLFCMISKDTKTNFAVC